MNDSREALKAMCANGQYVLYRVVLERPTTNSKVCLPMVVPTQIHPGYMGYSAEEHFRLNCKRNFKGWSLNSYRMDVSNG